ncbi:MAG: amidohydrolase family protein [Oscillospiraceae bacterium]|nr:amidohydrolase family protein [Oscillospiraceae bacterium]
MIDYHVHMGKSSSGHVTTPDDLVAYLDEFGIQCAGLSVLNGIDTREQNDTVQAACLQYPDRIVGHAYINPRDPKAIDEVHRCLGELKMRGVQLHSWKHGYYPENTPALDGILDVIESYGVPVLVHTGTAPLSLPQQWAIYAERHPGVTFVFEHLGYIDYGYSCVECVRNLENVYVETSGQVEIPVLFKAYHELGADRIIFGSDWPYKYPKSEIVRLEVLPLSDEEKEKIFHANAAKLLKL